MSGTPRFKVYDASGDYQAACKEIEAAAALMGFYGDGATIRDGHKAADIVWVEGAEQQPAFESYDYVAEVASKQIRERNIKSFMKAYGKTREEVEAIMGGAA